MKSETGRLPKGQSYPLRPSRLEAALIEAAIDIDTHLIRSPGDLFDVHFWPAGVNSSHERLYIRAGSVPSADLSQAKDQMEASRLPAMIQWLGAILTQDAQSPVRREEQRRTF